MDAIVSSSAVLAEAAVGISSASIPRAIAIIIASAIVLCNFFMISTVELYLSLFVRELVIRYCVVITFLRKVFTRTISARHYRQFEHSLAFLDCSAMPVFYALQNRPLPCCVLD